MRNNLKKDWVIVVNIQHWPPAPYTHTHSHTCTHLHKHIEHIPTLHTETHILCRKANRLRRGFVKYVQKKKKLTVNFGTREKISQKDGGILTVVTKEAGLPSPGFVTSSLKENTLQTGLRPLFTFQKCPSKAATASKARKTCPGKSGMWCYRKAPQRIGGTSEAHLWACTLTIC